MTQPLDPLLRDALMARRPEDGTAPCLDAEALAAWFEGTLSGDDRRLAEAHVADCTRCQMLIAGMARIAPPLAPRAWWRGSATKWIVPLTAAAASAVVWLNLPGRAPASRQPSPTAVITEAQPRAAAGSTSAPREAENDRQPELRAEAAAPADAAGSKDLRRREAPLAGGERQRAAAPLPPAPRVEALQDSAAIPGAATLPSDTMAESRKVDSLTASASPAASAAVAGRAAAAPPAAAPRADATTPPRPMAETVMRSADRSFASERARQIVVQSAADPRVVWRIGGASTVQRSTDGGRQWDTQSTGIRTTFNAGSSPSPAVCWIVGSGGVVLLSIDGRTWQRLAFPESVDLVAVTAIDARSAVVTAADGRRFATGDGGKSWKR